MSRRSLYTLLISLFLVENIIAFVLGVYYTIYSVGVYVLPSIWLYGLAPAFVYLAVRYKKRRNFWIVYLVGTNLLYLVYFGLFAIDKYKPTIKIVAPENHEGCIYLFHTDDEINTVKIDKNGIGYIQKKKAIYDFYVGDKLITNAGYGYNMPMKWNKDSTAYMAVKVECYRLDQEKALYYRENCLNWDEYEELVSLGWVDEARVKSFGRELEPSELLQQKKSNQFRMFWPTNLQRGTAGKMVGKPIHEKIFSYLTFKYDTLGSKTLLNCGFKQTFKKGFIYQEWGCDSAQNLKLSIRKTPYHYTKKLYATFFQITGYAFNTDSTKYFPLNGNGIEYEYHVGQENDSVFVEIKYPIN